MWDITVTSYFFCPPDCMIPDPLTVALQSPREFDLGVIVSEFNQGCSSLQVLIMLVEFILSCAIPENQWISNILPNFCFTFHGPATSYNQWSEPRYRLKTGRSYGRTFQRNHNLFNNAVYWCEYCGYTVLTSNTIICCTHYCKQQLFLFPYVFALRILLPLTPGGRVVDVVSP